MKSEQLIAAYQSDKNAFNKAMSSLKGEKDSRESLYNEMAKKNEELARQNQQLEERLKAVQLNMDQHKREVEMMERNTKRLNQEWEDERLQNKQLRDQLY